MTKATLDRRREADAPKWRMWQEIVRYRALDNREEHNASIVTGPGGILSGVENAVAKKTGNHGR